MERMVVVGAGMAGLRAAEAARAAGFQGALTIVGAERHRPYNRPPLSKQVLAGTMDPAACALETTVDAEWRLATAATALDVDRRRVSLSDGDELAYDGLVIATGSTPRRWPGLPEVAGFHELRTVDDAVALRDAVSPGDRVVAVGAGFIGCEVASTLAAKGADVTLLDVARYPMPKLGPEIGWRAIRLHAERGVRLRLNTGVLGFDGVGRVEAVVLDGGERIEADHVLLCLGAAPATSWLEGSGVRLDAGAVCCDREGFVAPGVVAAGDVVAFPHPFRDGLVRLEHWSNAVEMALCVGANLVADPSARTAYRPVPSFWTDQHGVRIQTVGYLDRAAELVLADEDLASGSAVLEGAQDGAIVCAATFAADQRIVRYRRTLMRESVAARVAPAAGTAA